MTSALALHSMLDSVGRQSAAIERLWWIMLWTTTAVFVVVLVLFAAAIVRGRRSALSRRTSSSTLVTAVSGAVALTVVILVGLLVASVWTGRVIASSRPARAVTISVIGHQWWWEIQYEDEVAARYVTLANEIHIPTGRTVVFKVTSRDVIHSFWAPNLLGKRDLIPGYTTAVWTEVDRPSVFHGQCAEFCGKQHAHMAFEIVAEPEADFERWLDGERQLAREPQSDEAKSGQRVFMAARCAGCHAIRGTDANGQLGPDLTHVASRTTLGSGMYPNTRGHLGGWVSNPQALKPGVEMPPNLLSADDLQSLLAYLEGLK